MPCFPAIYSEYSALPPGGRGGGRRSKYMHCTRDSGQNDGQAMHSFSHVVVCLGYLDLEAAAARLPGQRPGP